MNKTFLAITTLAVSLSANIAFADGGARPDSHAPISVMGEHAHKKGEFMFSYRYMNMQMEDNRDGSDSLTTSEVHDDFMVAPIDMDMQMHMLGLMYAPSNNVTLMAMLPLIDISMNHLTSPMMMNPMMRNMAFETEANGIGDTKLSSIIKLGEPVNGAQLLLNIGVSLPTGSIDEEDIVPTRHPTEDTTLPYPMQLGSGTYDILPAITYTKLNEKSSWGSQVSSVMRTGENDNGYTLGNRFKAQAWHAWVLEDNFSLSARLQFESWDNIDGEDNSDNRVMPANMMGMATVPTVNTRLRGGQKTDLALGFNSVWGSKSHRVAAEVMKPIDQNLDGPQLETDISFVLGYQIAF